MTPADEPHTAADKIRTARFTGAVTMLPAVAALVAAREPIAEWLEHAAKKHTAAIAAAASVWGSTSHADALAWLDTGVGQVSPQALAVARAILGTQETP